mgnify:CR=1 FL=1
MKLCEILEQKNIFITGAAGFVGKVFLFQILDQFPNIKSIYVLIRPSQKESAKQRFASLQQTAPFLYLAKKNSNFQKLWHQKVHYVEGDISEKDIFFDSHQRQILLEETDVVVNCAALISFNADLKKAYETHIHGAKHLCNFIHQSRKARLVHMSTAYVAGSRDGFVEECLQGDIAPNGLPFNDEAEQKWITEQIGLCDQHLLNDHEGNLKLIGMQRAKQWGWLNTYIYTKALAEKVIQKNLQKEQFCVVRPAIIESALRFPMAGWNEGFNTTGIFLYLNQQGFRFFVAKPENVVDIVPIDIVTSTLLAVCGAVLTQRHRPVYHIGTSDSTALTIHELKEYCYTWLKKNHKQLGFVQSLLVHVKPRLVKPATLFTATGMLLYLEKVLRWSDKIHLKLYRLNFIKALRKKLSLLSMTESTFQDFSYNYSYIFSNTNRMDLPYEDFNGHTETVKDWQAYWFEKHLPGLNQWVFTHVPKIF